MEPIIAGRDLRKSWGATLVLEHADFLLHAGDKVALVGLNGSGKSTLFRLLAGETTPDLGDLVLKPGLRYGYLPQVPNVPPETVVRSVLSAPSPEAQRIEAELAGLEAWMARPDAWDAADASARMARYESLHVARGAARSESVIVNHPILNDLGVGEELLDQRFGSLSGGEKSTTFVPVGVGSKLSLSQAGQYSCSRTQVSVTTRAIWARLVYDAARTGSSRRSTGNQMCH